MRNTPALVLISVLLFLGSCSDSTKPSAPDGNAFKFYGESYSYEYSKVSIIKQTDTYGSELYIMEIRLSGAADFNSPRVSFYLWSSGDDFHELLTPGEHRATGNNLSLAGVLVEETNLTFIGTEPLPFVIVWESITTTENSFSGNGHILIEEQMNYVCSDSLHTINGNLGPGTPEYDEYYNLSCEPGFYLPTQKLDFVCTDGILWIDEW